MTRLSRFAYLVVCLTFLSSPVLASDIPAMTPIPDNAAAIEICEESCAAHQCAWSGDWKKGTDGQADQCDCGKEREKYIPVGYISSKEQAKQHCTELCTLNEMPWTGKIARAAGAFEMCACSYVSEWCEPKTN